LSLFRVKYLYFTLTLLSTIYIGLLALVLLYLLNVYIQVVLIEAIDCLKELSLIGRLESSSYIVFILSLNMLLLLILLKLSIYISRLYLIV
jgi:hypothetical protein